MSDLGPRPDPAVEPGEPAPGGPDAQPSSTDGVSADDPAVRDPDPDKNPTTETVLPEEMKEGEDTDTAATQGEEAPDDEAPA